MFPVDATRSGRNRYPQGLALWVVLAIQTFGIGCSSKSGTPADKTVQASVPAAVREKPLVGVIDDGGTAPFDLNVREGMEAGALESGIEFRWFSCESREESELVRQLSLAEEQNVDAVCIQPFISTESSLDAMRRLRRNTTPVIFFRESVPTADFMSIYVGTDHFHAGRRLAEAVIERAEDATAIILSSAPPDDLNAVTRQRGFQFTMTAQQPDLEIREVGNESDDAPTRARAILKPLTEAGEGPRMVIAFVPAQVESIIDMLEEEASGIEPVQVVGFGSYAGIADDFRGGTLVCTLIEDPYLMGLSLAIAIAAEIEGDPPGDFVSSGEHVIVTDQLSDEGILKLLQANEP